MTNVPRCGALALLALMLMGCQKEGPHVVVGSKNFGEQILLGEIAAQQIERRLHVIVDRKLEIGGTMLAHEALAKGQIDLYPEYTGTALTAVLKHPINRDPKAVLAEVREGYKQWNLRWMDPLGFNNTFAMVVLTADARRRNIQTLSEAASNYADWRLGAGYEFTERPDGLEGLTKTYGFKFGAPERSMDLGLLYSALEQSQVNLIAANSTDGQLAMPDFLILDDDKHYFPPYEAAFVVRNAALEKFPGLEAALHELSGALTDQTMRALNRQVQGEHRSAPKVVEEWLGHLKK